MKGVWLNFFCFVVGFDYDYLGWMACGRKVTIRIQLRSLAWVTMIYFFPSLCQSSFGVEVQSF